jgi:hypothetical protein
VKAVADRDRRRALLAEIRRIGGRITTSQAHAFYRATGHGPCRSTARADLKYYTRRGVLVVCGPANDRAYRTAGGSR